MKCPYKDCTGDLVVHTIAEFAITEELSLHLQTIDLTEVPNIYCDLCGLNVPTAVLADIKAIVLGNMEELEHKAKEAINGLGPS